MPNDLHAICEELRQLGLRPETPAARAKLEEALSSKWEGVQVAAAKALSRWGDPRSVRSLKELLVAVAVKKGRSSTCGAVAKLLYPHMQTSDLDWLIDILIHGSRGRNCFELACLCDVPAFAPDEVRRRLAAKKTHGGIVAEAVRAATFRAEWRIKRETRKERG
jgi:hypothetical protein